MQCQLQPLGNPATVIFNEIPSITFKKACKRGVYNSVTFHLKDKYLTSDEIYNGFLKAIKRSHTLVVKLLLQDPRLAPFGENKDGLKIKNFALVLACQVGNLAIVKLILDDGRIKLENCKENAIHWAQTNGHQNVLDELNKRLSKSK